MLHSCLLSEEGKQRNYFQDRVGLKNADVKD